MSQLRSELKQSKPFDSLAQEVLLNVLRTADHLAAAQADLLRGSALTPCQYNVLRILRGAGAQGLPCQEVGARMVTRVPDVTRLLDRLERTGLVRRERSAADRRVVNARIEQAGLDLLSRLDEPVAANPPRLLSGLTEAEQRTLNDLLVRARRMEGEDR